MLTLHYLHSASCDIDIDMFSCGSATKHYDLVMLDECNQWCKLGGGKAGVGWLSRHGGCNMMKMESSSIFLLAILQLVCFF